MITINLDKAREIHKDKIRAARAPKFAELDVAFMQAVEQANSTEQLDIASQKQALRNLTTDPDIAAATNVDELKATWPVILGDSPYV